MKWNDIAYFLIVVVAFRFLFMTWFAGKVVELTERLLVRGERQAIEYLHYYKRAAKEGHKSKSVVDCGDDSCVKVTK